MEKTVPVAQFDRNVSALLVVKAHKEIFSVKIMGYDPNCEWVRDMELYFPYFLLLEDGEEVDITAPSNGAIRGERGKNMKITKTIDNVNG